MQEERRSKFPLVLRPLVQVGVDKGKTFLVSIRTFGGETGNRGDPV